MNPVVIKDDELRVRKLEEGSSLKIILDDKVGSKHLAMGVVFFEPGAKTINHVRDVEEVIFVTKGEATIVTDDAAYTLVEGDTIFIPPGVLHRHENRGNMPLEQVYIFSPQGPERALRDLEVIKKGNIG